MGRHKRLFFGGHTFPMRGHAAHRGYPGNAAELLSLAAIDCFRAGCAACLAVASYMLHKGTQFCGSAPEFCDLFWDE